MSPYLGVAVVIAAIGYLVGRVGKSDENPMAKRIEEIFYAVGLIAFLLAALL
jgi:cytochrome c oxidase assembly factor CtaG